MWTDFPLVLAQDNAAPPPTDLAPPPADQTGEGTITDPSGSTGPGGAPTQEPGSPFGSAFFMILIVMLLFVFLMGGGRREKKKRAAMLAAMAKGDKVQTIGGIRGTVLEIKDDEVVLKVDENANTRMRFASSAVQSVIESKNGEEAK